MPKTKYKARSGARFNNKEAQIIGETIEDLRNSEGQVTPEDLLKDAKKKTSPLNKYFEWSNSEAAHMFRLSQARQLVNHIVEIVIIEGESIKQRSFLSVKTEGKETVYVTLQDAIEDESYRKQLLNKAINILENLTITMKLFRANDKD